MRNENETRVKQSRRYTISMQRTHKHNPKSPQNATYKWRRASCTGAGTPLLFFEEEEEEEEELLAEMRGTFTRRNLLVNLGLYSNLSSGLTAFPRFALIRMRFRGVHKETKWRLHSDSGTPVAVWISWNVNTSVLLNSSSMHIWYVDTTKSWGRLL